MLFVVMMKWAAEDTPEVAKRAAKEMEKSPPGGAKRIGDYQLLGRGQSVSIVDVPDASAIAQIHAPFMDIVECDWAPAMRVEDLLKAMG